MFRFLHLYIAESLKNLQFFFSRLTAAFHQTLQTLTSKLNFFKISLEKSLMADFFVVHLSTVSQYCY